MAYAFKIGPRGDSGNCDLTIDISFKATAYYGSSSTPGSGGLSVTKSGSITLYIRNYSVNSYGTSGEIGTYNYSSTGSGASGMNVRAGRSSSLTSVTLTKI